MPKNNIFFQQEELVYLAKKLFETETFIPSEYDVIESIFSKINECSDDENIKGYYTNFIENHKSRIEFFEEYKRKNEKIQT